MESILLKDHVDYIQLLLRPIQLDRHDLITKSALKGAIWLREKLVAHFKKYPPRLGFREDEIRVIDQFKVYMRDLNQGKLRTLDDDDMMGHPFVYYDTQPSSYLMTLLGRHLFRMPASAAGGERNFSVYGKVHTSMRNRLNPKNLDMIVLILQAQPCYSRTQKRIHVKIKNKGDEGSSLRV